MEQPWFQPLVWMDYRLAVVFTVILPLVLLIWAFAGKSDAIQHLLVIYWRVASLLVITVYLMIGALPISFISALAARILIPVSLWFWVDINEDIDEILEPVINYKIGGEFRYDIFRLRGGYAMYADPTQYTNDGLDRDRMVISGGIGVNTPKFFADLGVINTRYQTDIFPYQGATFFPIEDIPEVDNSIVNIMLTVGINF